MGLCEKREPSHWSYGASAIVASVNYILGHAFYMCIPLHPPANHYCYHSGGCNGLVPTHSPNTAQRTTLDLFIVNKNICLFIESSKKLIPRPLKNVFSFVPCVSSKCIYILWSFITRFHLNTMLKLKGPAYEYERY